MLKKAILFSAVLALVANARAQWVDVVSDPVDLVNPLMGTQSTYAMSTGNTFPSIALPWGMNFWTPQTGRNGDGWQYTYTADKIRGFKQTHQPSPWMNDFGEFSLMPVNGMQFQEEKRASWFSHKAEVVKPYYYSVYLADHDVTTEMTPTERAVRFRFTFPKTDSAHIVIDAYDKGSYIKIIPGENKIVGYTTRNSGGVAKNFRNYFVVVFDRPFTSTQTWKDSTLTDSLELTNTHVGAFVGFAASRRGTVINARVASSFISIEQAERNLAAEIGKDDFATVEARGRAIWNKTLGRVSVAGGTIDQLRTFYSCLYRMLFFPMRMYEKDAGGRIVHYSPYNGHVESGYMFSGTGFWDTFRALYPFLNLVYPSINKEMQEGLVNDFKEGGWLPEWSDPGYRNVMIGNNSASVVADAYLKGLRGYDVNVLWEALLKDANAEGPIDAVGRRGVSYYNRLGYVPYDVHINENAARTLEYAYDDFCIYRLGKALGRPESELAIYAKRSQNYKNLFDPSHKLMRGKNQDGSFATPFSPFKWGDAFTEGNSWHYSWSVFHDIQGLIDLMGGKANFVQMLDSVFVMPPSFDDSYYGEVIHEIREMQIAGMGQYAHGNQPIQHMLYLYNYAGEPWKCQYWVREAMRKLYQATPDGYCGDEDNGQTSAWYVFSALGFYSVCPGTDQYVLGTPLFRKAVIHLENGKDFVISAPNNGAANPYVQGAVLNGQPYSRNWIANSTIVNGGTFSLTMGASPNKAKGVNPSDYPYSFSTDKNK
ncbi:MAG TPA: GH92 family glycosyl hydrolase [Puia sp.]|nr:GH92 family glycosyl hydrolase [Puia sp.]